MLNRYGLFNDRFDHLFRDFDDVFRRLSEEFGLSRFDNGVRALPGTASMLPVPGWSGRSFVPAVESFTRDGKHVFRVEVPGMTPEDIQVSVEGSHLTISGEKKAEKDVESSEVLVREVSRGRFQRVFALPEGLDAEQITASLKDGILEVTLPETARPVRRIPVTAGK